MHAKTMLVKESYLKEELESFLNHLLGLRYSENTVQNYRWVVNQFEWFLLENHYRNYSNEIADQFLSTVSESRKYTENTVRTLKGMLYRFDAFMSGRNLALRSPRVVRKCPIQFDGVFAEYLEDLRLRSYRERTVEDHRLNILKVLKEFDASGVKNIAHIVPANIYHIFNGIHRKNSFYSTLRQFLRFLFKNKILHDDYSVLVPSVRYSSPVPSIYTKSEIAQLLKTIDTSTKAGKRNYAIILLALRLGLRTGDIVNLKISDVNFTNKEICFIQEKTQLPQRLVLLPEIEKSLLSYLSTARPDCDSPNIFLSLLAPYRPLTPSIIWAHIHTHIESAGIIIGERKSGAHSLRMTLASELVAEKVPYDVVRKILGHDDPVSIKHYVKFDIESLRSCAIEIPPVTGKLAAYMETRLGGKSNDIYF